MPFLYVTNVYTIDTSMSFYGLYDYLFTSTTTRL